MIQRYLPNERRFIDELDEATTLNVITKAPGKYLLIDLENLTAYQGTQPIERAENGFHWKKISSAELFRRIGSDLEDPIGY